MLIADLAGCSSGQKLYIVHYCKWNKDGNIFLTNSQWLCLLNSGDEARKNCGERGVAARYTARLPAGRLHLHNRFDQSEKSFPPVQTFFMVLHFECRDPHLHISKYLTLDRFR